MAMAWIPMRLDLARDPRVLRLVELTGLDAWGVVGRLHALWAWLDEQTADGRVPTQFARTAWRARGAHVAPRARTDDDDAHDGAHDEALDASLRAVDTVCGHAGFASALIEVGWLEVVEDGDDESVYLGAPRWGKHRADAQTMKSRSLRAARQRRYRGADVDDGGAQSGAAVAQTRRTRGADVDGGVAPAWRDGGARVDGEVARDSATCGAYTETETETILPPNPPLGEGGHAAPPPDARSGSRKPDQPAAGRAWQRRWASAEACVAASRAPGSGRRRGRDRPTPPELADAIEDIDRAAEAARGSPAASRPSTGPPGPGGAQHTPHTVTPETTDARDPVAA